MGEDIERAGAVLREQVAGVIEAAKEADRNRLHAQESAGAMAAALREMESELTSLLGEVRREADALERSLAGAAPAADLGEPESIPDSPEAGLESQAQQSVAEKSDLELAELHQIAQDRVDMDTDEGREYWRALLAATVAEAVKRKDFGTSVADDESSWLERRRRAKALRPLASAREQAMRSEPQGDAGP